MTGGWSGLLLARIASMMLANDPEPSFVASVVAASEEDIQILVTSKHGVQMGGGSRSCGDSLGSESAAGWPEIYSCDLVENYPDADAPLIFDLDGIGSVFGDSERMVLGARVSAFNPSTSSLDTA
jgi:hypothetical protein